MVHAEVRKHADVKCDAVHALHFKPLRRHFHHGSLQTLLNHSRKVILQIVRLGRRVRRRQMLISDDILDRPDQSARNSRFLKRFSYHERRRRLALRSGKPDHRKFLRRMPEPDRAHLRKRCPVVVRPYYGNSIGNRHFLCDAYGSGSCLNCFLNEFMAVAFRTDDAYKQISCLQLSCVISNSRNLRPRLTPNQDAGFA